MSKIGSFIIDYADKHDISTDEALSRLEAEGAKYFVTEYNPDDDSAITHRGKITQAELDELLSDDHDCHLIAGEDGCDHPSHKGE